jgi:gliding motility-associated-like protein
MRSLKTKLSLLIFMCCFATIAKAQLPVAAFDVNDTITCIGTTVYFTDMSTGGVGGIVDWDWDFGDGGSSSLQDPSHSYGTGGLKTITLTVTDGASNQSTIQHTIFVIEAIANQSIVRLCSPQSTTTVSANAPYSAAITGYWFTAGSAVIADPTNDTTLVSNLTSGSYVLFWVLTDGFCSDADQVTILIDNPVTANAGPDKEICVTTATTTMAGSAPSPGTGLWTTSSSATITTPSNRNTSVTGLNTPGTYTFIWTVTNGACVTSDSMQVVVTALPTANAGIDQSICASPGTTTLTGNTPSVGTVMWSTTGSGTITSPTSVTTGVTGLTTTGVNTFIYTVTSSSCVNRDTVLVTVSQFIAANAGNDLQVCTTTGTATLNGNNPAPGTGNWTTTSSATITSPTTATTGVTGLSPAGFYYFVWTITNGGCVSRDTMVIIVRAPSTSNAGPDQTLCGATTATLAANTPSPGSGTWTTTSTATITTASSPTSGVTNLPVGNSYFIWSVTHGACVTRDTVLIHVDQLVTSAAGPDQQLCETTTSTTMAANTASPGTGTWTTASTAVITSPNSPTSTITGLTVGIHNFIWTIVNGSCTSRDTISVVVSSSISANAGSDQVVCTSTGTATLAGNTPSAGSGMWTTSSSATINTPTSPTSTVSGLTSAGIYTFIWTVTNGGCVERDTMLINVSASQTANAGPDQAFCETTSSATLAGNTPTAGTGTWTTTSGATITSINNPSTTVTGLTAGSYTFVWTIVNGSCTSVDSMTIDVSAQVVADAGIDQQVCSSDGIATMAANTPLIGSGAWFTSSSATITNATDPSTTITNLTTAGTYEFIWMVSNGTCLLTDTMQIVVDEFVQANAGPDQSLCSQTTTNLHAQGIATGTGVWISLGAASVTDPLDSLSAVTGLDLGLNQFVWLVSNGTCLSTDTMDVLVYEMDTAIAGPDQVLCSATGTATLSATTPTIGTGVWTTSSSATITSPANPASGVTGLSAAGNYDFIWTVTNGACISSDTITITVNASVAANAGSDIQICESTTSVNLAGNSASPGTGTWTTTGTATISNVNDPATSVSNLATGDNTFIWTIVNGLCTSTDTVIVTVDILEIADAGSDQQLCATTGSTNLAAATPAVGSGVWFTTSSASITDPLDPNSNVTDLTTAGTYEFIWMVNNGMCLSTDTMFIVVDEDVPADAGADQAICDNAIIVQLNATAPSSGTGVWISLGSASVDNPLDPASTVTGVTAGSNLFVWFVSNGLCFNSDTVNIEVSSLVVADAGIDQQVCASPGTATLVGSDPTPGTSMWTTATSASITDPSLSTTDVTSMTSGGNYDFIYTVTNGGCVSIDTITIAVDDSVVADAGADQSLCDNVTTVQLNAATPGIGTGVWISMGAASVDNPLDPLSTVTGAVAGVNSFVWMVSNGTCMSLDTTDIIISTLVVADANVDQQICASPGSTTLNGSSPLPGSSIWTTSSTAIISDSSLSSPTISGLNSSGTYEFIYTVTNGACVSADTMFVLVDDTVIVDAGPDQGLCDTDSTTNLSAVLPALGTGFWTTTSSATIVDPFDQYTLVTGLTLGSNEFIWNVSNGMCLNSDTVVVTLNLTPTTPNAGADVAICSNVNSILLSGNSPSIGVSQWGTTGTAVISNPNDSIVTVSGLSVGVNTFIYSIDNGGCILYDTVEVLVNPVPTADAGSDQFATASTPVVIGGTIPGSGGMAPYTYEWTPAAQVNDSSLGNPTASATITTSFVLTVTDSLGCQGTDTMILFINDPPVANVDSITIPEDSVITISVLSNDTDPDNNIDSSSISLLSGPLNGTATVDTINGTVTYTPFANYFGADSIMYSVCDLGIPVYCDTSWIYITITPVNDAPVANDDYYNTQEDSCITFNVLLNDTDVENNIDTATFAILTWTTNGTITLDTIAGQMTYCPDTLFNGNDTLTYIICDSGNPVLCDTAIVVITVSPLNNTPVAVNDSVQICSSDSIIIDVLANDTDAEGDTLFATLNSVPAHGSAIIASNLVTYYPDINYSGWDSIQYIACEVNNPLVCDTAWIMIDVHGVPSLSSTHILPLCAADSTGSIDLTVSGNGPFTYNWSNADTTEDISLLPTGIYTVMVVDSFGCSSSITDTISAPAALLASAVTQQVSCYGDSTGAIDITVTGGVTPYMYSWSNLASTEDINLLPAGIYTLAVTDSNGCSVQWTDTIREPLAPLSIVGSRVDVICASDSTGSIDITVSGGTPSYVYSWTTTATTEDISSLAAGVYTVTVTDSNLCAISFTDTILSTNPVINASYSAANAFCIDSIGGSIDVTATGGTGTLTYLWNTSDVTEDLSGIYAGNYTVTITDSLNCFNILNIIIADTSTLNLNITGSSAICQGSTLDLNVTDYTNVTYQWMNDSTAIASGTAAVNTINAAGSYYVVATSACGTFISDTVNISVNSLPVVTLDDATSTTCDSSIVLTASGGISYLWSPAGSLNDATLSAPLASPQEGTIYIVAVTDTNGCVSYDSITVDVTCVTLTIPNGFSPNGDGYNDAFVILKLEDYPDNKLRIFSRWGNMVYEMNDYDNSWNGTANVNVLMKGKELPAGTYYYVLDLNNKAETQTGFVVLRR